MYIRPNCNHHRCCYMDLKPSEPARSSTSFDANFDAYPYQSWAALMEHQCSKRTDAPFIIYPISTQQSDSISYLDFLHTSRRLSAYFHSIGIRRGSSVGVASHNHPHTILTYFALWYTGACAVPLNMGESDERLKYIIADSGCDAIAVHADYGTRIGNLFGSDQEQILLTPEFFSYLQTEFSSDSHDESLLLSSMLFDPCLIVYTSGTTGNPKGVVLLQQNLFADGFAIADWHAIDSATRMMCILPIHHVNGIIVTHVTPFIAGASVVLVNKYSTTSFFQLIDSYDVNIVSLVPTILAFLSEHYKSQTAPPSLRHVICGAGPLTSDLAKKFSEKLGITVIHGYGLSETTCYSCFLPLGLSRDNYNRWLADYGFPSIGIPLPVNDMSIHDSQGIEAQEMVRGEIVVRGPNVMLCYYNNELATHTAFKGGWFHTGDEGFYKVDEYSGDRFFFITGRIKELIIRGGVNISPLEIDEVINRVPGVKAGICVGFDHYLYGEEIGALVVPDNSDLDQDTLSKLVLDYCATYLPVQKCPKVVLITNNLPVTSTGKYRRSAVKDLFSGFRNQPF